MTDKKYYSVRKCGANDWYFKSKALVLQAAGCNNEEEKIYFFYIYEDRDSFFEFFTGQYLGERFKVSSSIGYQVYLYSPELGYSGIFEDLSYYGSNDDFYCIQELSAVKFAELVEPYLDRRSLIAEHIQAVFDERKQDYMLQKRAQESAKAQAISQEQSAQDFLNNVIQNQRR